jgi:hypothetical protein
MYYLGEVSDSSNRPLKRARVSQSILLDTGMIGMYWRSGDLIGGTQGATFIPALPYCPPTSLSSLLYLLQLSFPSDNLS